MARTSAAADEGSCARRARGRSTVLACWLAATVLAGCLGGCAESIPTAQLPDLVQDPRKFLTKQEQEQAITEMSQKKAAQQAEIERQDKPKPP